MWPHDDVIKWKHFPRYWSFVRGIHRSPVNSPHKGQWRGALIFSLICVWINGWVNNREVGDLRRYRAHYDVIVMWKCHIASTSWASHWLQTLSWHPGNNPDNKVHGANMGPIWGRQDPGGPHVGPMNFAIWERENRLWRSSWTHCLLMTTSAPWTCHLTSVM